MPCDGLAYMQAASNLKSIHLLRALLREASYIPDASARQYLGRYIVSRFRAYQPSQNATASIDVQALEQHRHRAFKRRHASIIIERTRSTQRQAQKGLNYLRRANQGELPCLRKILLLAYGRMGRRKYELLGDLLRPEIPVHDRNNAASADTPAPLHQLYYSDKRFLSFFDAPKKKSATELTIEISDRHPRLKTVVKSQVQAGIAIGRDIKRPHLLTPIRNVWERPMPIKRARNNVKRWYAETMTRLLPPLPNDEWDRLHALTTGEKWIEFAKPRTRAIELQSEPRNEDAQWRAFIHQALALDKPSKADRQWGNQRPHNITTRFMRRLYAKILALSCKLEWNEDRSKWYAVWGNKPTKLQIYSAAVDGALFAGVDAKGQLLQRPPRVRRATKPELLSS
ncbi:hypothetical protein K505DRAFT_353586 [Melanomma pulvis-pyrius CBS 109.77]|uniref:LYR motif-containing protein Cup1-like N-terminal domain-containing protein n=1 Tax=Melanomma pulvis-pyrius CBS 109.77 TaxID=1314802 RepID=A0A6A6WVS2_9PLEO|nr:hypothetical protein K505DRAFT_353586 [Melanomma pulvis-pyrius CBS 109.77]